MKKYKIRRKVEEETKKEEGRKLINIWTVYLDYEIYFTPRRRRKERKSRKDMKGRRKEKERIWKEEERQGDIILLLSKDNDGGRERRGGRGERGGGEGERGEVRGRE
uniref:Uncharacterized protein n=1 Tax=Cacopsylla melanoneura TaxID=428564 RepID=A0A8D8ZJB1_9HEMI